MCRVRSSRPACRVLGASPRTRKVNPRILFLLIGVAVVTVVADQISKFLVVTYLPLNEVVPVVGDLLQFRHVKNPGAAFSLGLDYTWIFSILATAVTIFIIVFSPRILSRGWAVVFGLLLGGVLGNLIDRLFREPGFGVGHVVDFLKIPLLPAIFNIADVAITCAMALFLILTIMGVNLNGTRGDAARRDKDLTAAPENPQNND